MVATADVKRMTGYKVCTGQMSDFEAVFDAIEQLKREHPAIVRAMEVIEQCQPILRAYYEATRPRYWTVTTTFGACATNAAWIGNVAEND